MLLVALFYFVMVLIIITLVFVLLLYSDSDKRMILPALLSEDYGVVIEEDKTLNVYGSNYIPNYSGNTFGIGSGNTSIIPVSFSPPEKYRSSDISGSFVFLMSSDSEEGSDCSFSVFDNGSRTIIGEESRFFYT